MWPGQQPPGGEQNPQDPNQQPYQQPGYQQPNPYQQQPGYPQQPGPPPQGAPQGPPPQGAPQQQPGPPNTPAPYPPGPPTPGPPTPGPYQQQGAPQWNTPAQPLGAPEPPRDNRKKTTITALVAAGAVVVAAGVTGFLVLGGDKDKQDESKGADKKPSSSAPQSPSEESSPTQEGRGNGRGNGTTIKPVIPGWKVVVNPKRGTAFDVPADWLIKEPSMMTSYVDEKTEKPVTSMTGVAEYKPEWCQYDDDQDGEKSDWKLAGAGTKGANGARNSGEAAQNVVGWWIYGPYTQPNQKNIGLSKPKAYTSKSGLKGSIAYAESQGVPKSKNPCATEGKALSFAFKNKANDYVVWSLYGPRDVKGELDKETIDKILSSVRLAGMPEQS
ncbi:hypothetical protein ACFQVC_41420 [Streptomyces monticola]|uniref:DUF8017 domain-containing protein n=1 Tax=Streptomyces monticola TaxID=2666263 RepID=A0ABW2JX38_9ACTN